MRLNYLIIDHFYDDPHVVRNTALHTDYARMVKLFFFTLDKSKLHGSGLVTGPTVKTSGDPGSSRSGHG